MTPKPSLPDGIPLNEPQPCPECGREGLPRSTAIHRALAHGVRGPRIDRRFARVTLTGPDRRRKSVPLTETEGLLLDYIDDLECEAQGIPLNDVELPDLWSIARHVATDSSAHHPRFHHPSGECEQYGRHIHQPGFIVWERESSPVEEGERPPETHEQKQQRLRREEEDRL